MDRLRALFERWVRRVTVELDSGCIYISGAVEFDDRPGPVRDAFYRKVAGKSPSAVKAYWNQLIFSGREVPPVAKTSDEDVVAFVHSNPGALGYVAADTDTKGVKTIELKD